MKNPPSLTITESFRLIPPILASLCTALFFNSTAQAVEAVTADDVDIPSITRSVTGSMNDEYVDPYIPAVRTTQDGRLGINFKNTLEFYLYTPEKITTNFVESPNGAHILAHDHVIRNVNNVRDGLTAGHKTLCEVPNAQGEIQNPYSCGANGADDCYDITIVMVSRQSGDIRMTGTPTTVSVSNPKTPNAAIRDIVFGQTQRSPHRLEANLMFEPMVTADGNLMVGRAVHTQFTWQHSQTNENITGRYDMVYLAAPDDPTMACDVSQWDEMKPLSHAPFDPEVNTRYGFALKQFRDPSGELVPDGVDMAGSYPWVDAEGDNVGFSNSMTDSRIDTLEFSCIESDPACRATELRSHTNTLMNKTIMGLWTNGKMIMADGRINHQDYASMEANDTGHRRVQMFSPNSLNGSGDGKVRVGHGRSTRGNPDLFGDVQNDTFFESVENKFNFWENLKPVTPRDIVWNFSTGAATDEFAFDDYMFPDGFILSSMVQAMVTNPGNSKIMDNFNGITDPETRVQNGATADPEDWITPAWGEVVGSRIERAAVGGLLGRGLWMNGDSYIQYDIGAQPNNIRNNDWHISLYVDARYDDNSLKRLITFPDGSELQLVGRNQVRYWDGNIRRRITLPESIPFEGWAHIGVQMTNGNRTAEFYYNGFLLDRYTNNVPFMELSQGQLYVGSNPNRGFNGIRGWIDEFKVIAHHSPDESWCNHANGTLIGINGTDQWSNTASGYPQYAHNDITNFLSSFGKQTHNQYACYHDYSDDHAGSIANIPTPHDRVGDDYNFPEGPLVHDQPRPESRNNEFCLACHTADGEQGLDLDALALNTSLNAVDDPRRQPLQAKARVFGNIPASWIAPGLPAVSMVAPTDGLPIDPILAGVDPSLSTTPTDPVVFYQGANFTGTSWALTEGVYLFFDVRTGPIGQDRISSIEIPDGYVVRICDRTGGGDPCGDFTSDQATLGTLNNVTNHIEITLQ